MSCTSEGGVHGLQCPGANVKTFAKYWSFQLRELPESDKIETPIFSMTFSMTHLNHWSLRNISTILILLAQHLDLDARKRRILRTPFSRWHWVDQTYGVWFLATWHTGDDANATFDRQNVVERKTWDPVAMRRESLPMG